MGISFYFDEAAGAMTPDGFSAFRQRYSAVIDLGGVAVEQISNKQHLTTEAAR